MRVEHWKAQDGSKMTTITMPSRDGKSVIVLNFGYYSMCTMSPQGYSLTLKDVFEVEGTREWIIGDIFGEHAHE